MSKKVFLITLTLIFLFSFVSIYDANASGIQNGDLIRNSSAEGDAKYDIYIVKIVGNEKYKRLILNPKVFLSYGHLKPENVQDVGASVMNQFETSNLVVPDINGDGKPDGAVYKLTPQGDTGKREHMDMTSREFTNRGYKWNAVYTINAVDFESYGGELLGQVVEETDNRIKEIKYYQDMSYLSEINGKMAYRAKKDDKEFIVYDEIKQKEYDKVGPPVEVNGKLTYWARGGGYDFVVYGSEEQKRYNSSDWNLIFSPLEVDGKLVYVAHNNERKDIIVYGGKELEEKYDKIFASKVNDKLAFLANQGAESFIVYKGKKYGVNYDAVGSPKDVNGKLTYLAWEKNKEFLVYGDQEIKKDYTSVGLFKEINGKLVYVARDGEDGSFVVYGGKELSKYEYIHDGFCEIGGSLVYLVSEDDKWSLIFYNNGQGVKKYEEGVIPLAPLVEVDGKLAYAAKLDEGKKTVIYNDQKQGEYDDVLSLIEIDGRLIYAVEQDGKLFLIKQK